ncbi:phage tail protein, partial [Acinetobacter baumannii]|nr:phage tail protein [Acinetobacter baumannii]EKU2513843.1 phage tail protein [Acinetobacter baumannii]EKU5628601.1 phage tail protein [Acinetobacter baumannii]EKV2087341.1 phage tail protein [Acinetobacter baumannii]EKW8163410.1 phage tail protein [Acinetobacter baumannii]
MTKQVINVGSAANDGSGTPARTAFQYINANFTELYDFLTGSTNGATIPTA